MSPQFHRKHELPFKKLSTPKLQPAARRLRISNGCRVRHLINKEAYVFRKSILALAAVAALGTAALTPTAADAHWNGYGWYGHHYHYKPYHFGFYGPRYFHGPRYFFGGWKYGWTRGYGYY